MMHQNNRRPVASLLLGAGVALLACAPAAGGNVAAVGSVVEMSSPAVLGSGEPYLFAARDGRVHMSWLERTDQRRATLRFATLQDGRWSEPATVARGDDFFVNWADFPSIVELPDGRLAAHWLRRNGPGTYHYEILVSQSADAGLTWSEPVRPHRDDVLAEHGFVSMMPWEGDSLAAVWLDGRNYGDADAHAHDAHGAGSNQMMLQFTTIHAHGGLGAERTLDARVCECCQTSAARASTGPVVVYRNRSEGEIRDIGIVRRVDGEWTEPTLVHDDGWEIAGCPVNGPSVAARGSDVVVAWFTAPRDEPRVNVAFSNDAGATFAQPIRVDDGNAIGRVSVLLDGRDALVVWMERVGEGAEVRVRRVSSAGHRSAATTVAVSTTARASGFPRMVHTGNELVFAWTQPGDTSRVHVARAGARAGDRP